MAEVSLQRSRIVPLVGQRKATGVPEHMRVRLEAQLSGDASTFHKPGHRPNLVFRNLMGFMNFEEAAPAAKHNILANTYP